MQRKGETQEVERERARGGYGKERDHRQGVGRDEEGASGALVRFTPSLTTY